MSNSSQPSWNNAVLKDNQINSGVWAHHCHSTAHFWSTDHYFSIRHRSGVSPLKPKEQKAKNKTYPKALAPSLTQCMPQATGTAAFMGWPSTGCLVLKSHHQKPEVPQFFTKAPAAIPATTLEPGRSLVSKAPNRLGFPKPGQEAGASASLALCPVCAAFSQKSTENEKQSFQREINEP